MPQAFIIMQIGNPDLDKICEAAILPALRSCGLDPKRVDKHNSGGLLKSEIINFITSSDIIVADLTNERPNCYLEVGYAMGADRNSRLILTAREDHREDSPNRFPGGPKIHFDLAGYDILFWDTARLAEFSAELEKRVKRRLSQAGSLRPGRAASSGSHDWVERHKAIALERIRELDCKGFMEVSFEPQSPNIDKTKQELERAAQTAAASIPSYWNFAPVSIGRNRVVKGVPSGIGVEFDPEETGMRSYPYTYWALNENGELYCIEEYLEDCQGSAHLLWADDRVLKFCDVLLYCCRLYSNFLSTGLKIAVEITHHGLATRQLGSRGGLSIGTMLKAATEAEVTGRMTVLLPMGSADLKSWLIRDIQRLSARLFALFEPAHGGNFYEPRLEECEFLMRHFVERAGWPAI
jgi:hypothetical protein